MCLIFLAINHHPDYKLILAGNRDEFYNRRTAPAAFWEDHPDVLAGRDLEAMGTWLGISRSGRISTLTNYRDPQNINPKAPSRGHLVADFLIGDESPKDYVTNVFRARKPYNGFNLLAGTPDEYWYYSNYGPAPQQIGNGLYGLSNHLLDSPWPKVVRGKERLTPLLLEAQPDPEKLFDALFDAELAPDPVLPDTGLPKDLERALSSMFIRTKGYGSRNSTVIMIDRDNHVFFAERVFNTETFHHRTETFHFKIQ